MIVSVRHSSPFNPDRLIKLTSLARLTPRQREVAVLIAQGYSKPEAAETLSLSVSTVKSHVHWILKHLGLKSRCELSLLLLREGLIDSVIWTRSPELVSRLTPRQLAVLQVIGPTPDVSHDEAGEILGLSPHTIKYHVGRIYHALGVSSREELTSKYREMTAV